MTITINRVEGRLAIASLKVAKSVAVLILAHNEAGVIESTIRSVCRVLDPQDAVYVIADNCLDATADRAARAGAIVRARLTGGPDGKGAAMKWFVDEAGDLLERYDMVVILDADNQVPPEFMSAIKAGYQGEGIMQCFVQPVGYQGSPLSTLIALSEIHEQKTIDGMRARFGWPVRLKGTGMVMTPGMLTTVADLVDTEVEDIALSLLFGARGILVKMNEQICVYDPKPREICPRLPATGTLVSRPVGGSMALSAGSAGTCNAWPTWVVSACLLIPETSLATGSNPAAARSCDFLVLLAFDRNISSRSPFRLSLPGLDNPILRRPKGLFQSNPARPGLHFYVDPQFPNGIPEITMAACARVNPGLDHSRKWGRSIHIAVALLVLLLALYGLTYSGHFSTDDEHILASRSLGLAFDGRLNDNRVLGNDRISAYLALPAQQASQSVGIEPIQSVLGAGFARLALLVDSGRVQTLFLLNIFATALGAVCVFASVRALGYPDRTALVTALLFSLGTQAWPYTRTFFRDSLAMLFLAFAWTCALLLNRGGSRRGQFLAGTGILLGLLLGVLTKNTITVCLPAIVILLIPFLKRLRSQGTLPLKARNIRPSLFLLGGIALAGILIFLLTARGPLARFSLSYYAQLLVFFFTSPHPNFLQALFGPLVSPGKSLFLFSPVLLLSLVALFQKRIEAFAAWTYVILLIVAQALFYDGIWWGNVNWGLRFLAPTMPVLTIASVALIHRLLHSPKGWVWIALFGGISSLVQLIGISAPLGEYYQNMLSQPPAISMLQQLWNIKYSALVWTAHRILSGGQWDLAVLRVGLPGLLIAVVLVALASLVWIQIHSRPVWITPLILGCTFAVILFLPNGYSADSAYYPARSDFQAARADLNTLVGPADVLVISSYGTPAWNYWMNWGPADPPWVSLPFSLSDSSALPAGAEAILSAVSASYQRVWLLLPCDSPPSAALLAHKDQLASLKLVAERTYQDGTCLTSLLLFQSR